MMNNAEITKGPEKCQNCGSENLFGPRKYRGGYIHITNFTQISQETFVCVDCGHTMLFTSKEDEYKVDREVKLLQEESQ